MIPGLFHNQKIKMIIVEQKGQNPFLWSPNIHQTECPTLQGPCVIIVEKRFITINFVDELWEVVVGKFDCDWRHIHKFPNEKMVILFGKLQGLLKNDHEWDFPLFVVDLGQFAKGFGQFTKE
jgi:hypothetical protein